MGELFIVIGCGLFFLLTAIISYYRFNKEISHKNFISVIVKEKKDLWVALKTMLSKELKEE